jgi:hypothetical protein
MHFSCAPHFHVFVGILDPVPVTGPREASLSESLKSVASDIFRRFTSLPSTVTAYAPPSARQLTDEHAGRWDFVVSSKATTTVTQYVDALAAHMAYWDSEPVLYFVLSHLRV